MSVDTYGKIRGFIRHEEICDFIRQKWDKNAEDDVSKHINCPIAECNWKYTINEHSEDNENWYSTTGFISFKHNDEHRALFYCYNNLNSMENKEYYAKHNLLDMVEAETTTISLGCWGSSVQIIKELIAHFGGGWIDENDCDDKEYYPVGVARNHTIKPVRYVTMEDVYKKFGEKVIITDR